MNTQAKFRQWSLRLSTLTLLLGAQTALAQATATCPVTPQVGSTILLGESGTFTFTLSNAGTSSGYAPGVELFIPQTLPTNQIVAGTATAEVGTLTRATLAIPAGANTYKHPVTKDTRTVPAALALDPLFIANGATLVVYRLPLSGMSPSLGAFEIDVPISPSVVLGQTQNIVASCGFFLGSDALNNPGDDAPVMVDASFSYQPVALRLFKDVVTDTHTVTGPDHPVIFSITAQSATLATLQFPVSGNFDLTDTLPSIFQATNVVCPAGFTMVGSVPATPGGTVTCRLSGVTGSNVAPVGTDFTMQVTGFVPECTDGLDCVATRILPATGAPVSSAPTTAASSAYQVNGGAVDAAGQVSGVAQFTTHGVLVRESVPAPGPFNPGNVVSMRSVMEVSDYFSSTGNVLDTYLASGAYFNSGSVAAPSGAGVVTVTGVSCAPGGTVANGDGAAGPQAVPNFAGCLGGDCPSTANEANALFGSFTARGGSSKATFVLPNIAGNAGGGAGNGQGEGCSVTYDVTIQELYADNDDVRGADAILTRHVLNTVADYVTSPAGNLTGLQQTEVDSASNDTLIIKDLDVAKSIAAVNGTPLLCSTHVNEPSCSLDTQCIWRPASSVCAASLRPGDVVTWKMAITNLAGDAVSLDITDYLPAPLNDGNEYGSFTNEPTSGWPSTGEIRFCAAPTECPASSGSYCEESPLCAGTETSDDILAVIPGATLTTTSVTGNNDVKIALPGYTSTQTQTITLLLDFTVRSDSVDDGLTFTNFGRVVLDGTAGATGVASLFAGFVMREPELSLYKGVIATSRAAGAVFTADTSNSDCAHLGVPSGLNVYSSALFRTSGCAGSLRQVPSGRVSGLDAEDTVRFALTLENSGHGAAFDVEVSEILDWANDPHFGGLGMAPTLTITDGAGNPVAGAGGAFFNTGSAVPAGLTLANNVISGEGCSLTRPCGIPACSSFTPGGVCNDTSGANVRVITWELRLRNDATAGVGPAQALNQRVSELLTYRSVSGPTFENFVREVPTAAVPAQYQAPQLAALLPGNSQVLTRDDGSIIQKITQIDRWVAPDASTAAAYVDSGQNAATLDAGNGVVTIGDLLRYRITVNLTEGRHENLRLVEALPQGLRLDPTVALVLTSGSSNLSFSGPTFSPVLPQVGAAGAGTNVTLDFGLVRTTGDTDNSGAPATHQLVIDLPVRVDNALLNFQGDVKTASASFDFDTPGGITRVPAKVVSNLAAERRARVYTPLFAFTDHPSTAFSVDAADTVVAQFVIDDLNVRPVDVHNLQFRVVWPTVCRNNVGDFTLTPVGCDGAVSTAIDEGNRTATVTCEKLSATTTTTLAVQATCRIVDTPPLGAVVTATTHLTGTTQGDFCVDSTGPGTNCAASPERNGTQVPLANYLATSASFDIQIAESIFNLVLNAGPSPLDSSFFPATLPVANGASKPMVVGEATSYHVRFNVGQGTYSSFVIEHDLTAGLEFLDIPATSIVASADFQAEGCPIQVVSGPYACPALVTALNNTAGGTNGLITRTLSNLVNHRVPVLGANAVTLEFDVNVRVKNVQSNQRGTQRLSTIRRQGSSLGFIFLSKITSVLNTNAFVQVAEPLLTVTTHPTPAPATGDAGDVVTVTVAVSNPTHTNGATARGGIAVVTLPAQLVPDHGSLVATSCVGATVTSASGQTVTVELPDIADASSCSFTFQATVTDAVVPNTTLTSSATDVRWTSCAPADNALIPNGPTAVLCATAEERGGTDTTYQTGEPTTGAGLLNDYRRPLNAFNFGITNYNVALQLMQTLAPTVVETDFARPIGDIVRYRATVRIPEGTSPPGGVSVQGTLPAGLTYLGTDPENAALVFSNSDDSRVTCGGAGCADTGAVPAATVSGQNVTWVLPGAVRNCIDGGGAGDDCTSAAGWQTLAWTFAARVANVQTNQANTAPLASPTVTVDAQSPVTPFDDLTFTTNTGASNRVNVVEPNLVITAGPTPDRLTLDASDTVTLTTTFDHDSAVATEQATAHDVELSFDLPVGLSPNAGTLVATGCVPAAGGAPSMMVAGQNVTVLVPQWQVTDSTCEVSFTATAVSTAAQGTVLTLASTSRLTWTSQLGDPPAAPLFDRTGADGSYQLLDTAGTILNDYRRDLTPFSVQVSNLLYTKAFVTSDSPRADKHEVTIGTEVTYRFTLNVPQGQTTVTTGGTDSRFYDRLPPGLFFVPGSAVVTNANDADLTCAPAACTDGVTTFQPTVTSGTSASGQVLAWDFGTVSNTGTGITQTLPLVVEYRARVANINSSTGAGPSGDTLTTRNQSTNVALVQNAVFYNNPNRGVLTCPHATACPVANEPLVDVLRVHEPRLVIHAQPSLSVSSGDAGDVIKVQARIRNWQSDYTGAINRPADAYDVRYGFQLPGGLTPVAGTSVLTLGCGTPNATPLQIVGQRATIALDVLPFDATNSATCDIEFDARVDDNVHSDQNLVLVVTGGTSSLLTWTTVAGAGNGTAGAADGERTGQGGEGADGTVLNNNAVVPAAFTFTVNPVTYSMAYVASTGALTFGTDVNVGDVRYWDARINVPEGQTPIAAFRFNVPAGWAFSKAYVLSHLDDLGATAATDQVTCSAVGGCARTPIAPLAPFISTGAGSPAFGSMNVATDVTTLVSTSGTSATGQVATLNLGTVTNEEPVSGDPENGANYRSVIIRVALAVQNINNGTGGATLRNQNDDPAFTAFSGYFVNPEATGAGSVCPTAVAIERCALSSDAATLRMVEPHLTLPLGTQVVAKNSLAITPTTSVSGDADDTFRVRLTINALAAASRGSDAHGVAWRLDLPVGLTVTAASHSTLGCGATSETLVLSNANRTGTLSLDQVPAGTTGCQLEFDVRLDSNVSQGTALTTLFASNLTWSTLPDAIAALTVERNGSGGTGPTNDAVLNNYFLNTPSVTFNTSPLTYAKAFVTSDSPRVDKHEVAIGNEVTYRFTLNVPEGQTAVTTGGTDSRFYDRLPPGLFVVPGSAVVTNANVADLTCAPTACTHGSAAFQPTVISGTSAAGQVLAWNFGTISNTGTGVTQTLPLVVEYRVRVANINSTTGSGPSGDTVTTRNQNTDVALVRNAIFYNNPNRGGTTCPDAVLCPVANEPVGDVLRIHEPKLVVSAQPSLDVTTGDAGDVITVRASLRNWLSDYTGVINRPADAFDVRFGFELPPGLTPLAGTSTLTAGCGTPNASPLQIASQRATIAIDVFPLDVANTAVCDIEFDAQVDDDVHADEPLSLVVTGGTQSLVTWTSMAGAGNGTSGAADGERTGQGGAGADNAVLNNSAIVPATFTFTVNPVTYAVTYVGTAGLLTFDTDVNVGDIRYWDARINVPEGQTPLAAFRFNVPPGWSFENAHVTGHLDDTGSPAVADQVVCSAAGGCSATSLAPIPIFVTTGGAATSGTMTVATNVNALVTTAGVPATGQTLTLNLGTLTSEDPGTTNTVDGARYRSVVVRFGLAVENVNNGTGGATLRNQNDDPVFAAVSGFFVNPEATGGGSVCPSVTPVENCALASDATTVRVVEPNLTVALGPQIVARNGAPIVPSTTATGDAADVFRVRLTVAALAEASRGSHAYEAAWQLDLPVGLTVLAATETSSGCGATTDVLTLSNGNRTGTLLVNQVEEGSAACQLEFDVRLDSNVAQGTSFSSLGTSRLTWKSLPDALATATTARTGADGTGPANDAVLNNYFLNTGTLGFTVAPLTYAKAFVTSDSPRVDKHEVAIGNEVTYRFTLNVPEGQTAVTTGGTDSRFYDRLPPGLFVVPGSAVVTNANVADLTCAPTACTHGSAAFQPTVISGTSAAGQVLAWNFGTISNTGTGVTQTLPLVVEYRVRVANINSTTGSGPSGDTVTTRNQNTDVALVRNAIFYNNPNRGGTTCPDAVLCPVANEPVGDVLRIHEPKLVVSAQPSLDVTTGDAGDVIAVRASLRNWLSDYTGVINRPADAFDVRFGFQLPPGLTPVPGSSTLTNCGTPNATPLQITSQRATIAIDVLPLDLTNTAVCDIEFDVSVDDDVHADEELSLVVTGGTQSLVTWTSMAGAGNGTSGAADGERTGQGGAGADNVVLNNSAIVPASFTFTVNPVTYAVSYVGAAGLLTFSTDVNVGDLRYWDVRINVPEGQTPIAAFRLNVPVGWSFEDAYVANHIDDTGATAIVNQVDCTGGCAGFPVGPIPTFVTTGGSAAAGTMNVGTDVSSLVTTAGVPVTGQTLTLNLGTLTSEDPGTGNPDDGPQYRSVVVRFALGVENLNNGVGGALLRNQNDDAAFTAVSGFFVNPEATGAGSVCPSATPVENCALASDATTVRLVEPNLTVAAGPQVVARNAVPMVPATNASGDADDVFRVRLTVAALAAAARGSNAYEAAWQLDLPVGLTAVAGSATTSGCGVTPVALALTNSNRTGTLTASQIAAGSAACQLEFDVQLDSNVAQGTSFSSLFSSNLTWKSLPDLFATATTARTGADGTGPSDDSVLNNYFLNTGALGFSVTPLSYSKAFVTSDSPRVDRHEVSIGNEVTYRFTLNVPEGLTDVTTGGTDSRFYDRLPPGLFVVPGSAVVVNANDADLTCAPTACPDGSPAFQPTVISGGSAAGQVLAWDFGTIGNTGTGATQNLPLVVEYRVRVANINSTTGAGPSGDTVTTRNQNTDAALVQNVVFYNNPNRGGTTCPDVVLCPTASEPLAEVLRIHEPRLVLHAQPSLGATTGDAGDIVAVRASLRNWLGDYTGVINRPADAFDVRFGFELPPGLTPVAGSSSFTPGCGTPNAAPLQITGQRATIALDVLPLDATDTATCDIEFDVRVDDTVHADQVLDLVVLGGTRSLVTWTTVANAGTGTPGAADGERTGQDGPGADATVLNNNALFPTGFTFTVNPITYSMTYVASDGLAFPSDVSVGDVRYWDAQVNLPEGVSDVDAFVVNVPAGWSFQAAYVARHLDATGATAATDNQVVCSATGGCAGLPATPIPTFISGGAGAPTAGTINVGMNVTSLVGAAGLSSAGQTLTLNLGSIINQDPGTGDPVDGPRYRSVVVRFALVVDNLNNGAGGAPLRNQNDDPNFTAVSGYFVNPEATGGGTVCPSATPAENCALASDATTVRLVEPDLTVALGPQIVARNGVAILPATTAVGDAGDVFRVRLTVAALAAAARGSNAYDATWRLDLPVGLTAVAGTAGTAGCGTTPVALVLTNSDRTGALTANQIVAGSTACQLELDIRLDSDVSQGSGFTSLLTSQLTWTSLPNLPAVTTTERTGADGTGPSDDSVLNNYFLNTGTVTLNVTPFGYSLHRVAPAGVPARASIGAVVDYEVGSPGTELEFAL